MRLSLAVPSPAVAINISSTAVSVVALRYQPMSTTAKQPLMPPYRKTNKALYPATHYYLESYAITPLNQAQMVDNQIVDVEQMGQVIAQLVGTLQLQAQHVAMALPQALTLSQHITMPAWLLEAEIEAQICIDAEQYIPYPLDEVSFDFEIIASASTHSRKPRLSSSLQQEPHLLAQATDQVDVLLVVTLTRHVEQMVDTLAFAGLTAQLIEVDTHAIERAWQLIERQLPGCPPVVALIDIGDSRTTVYVVKGGMIVYQSEQLFGGAQLTQSLQAGYQLTVAQAQQVKLNWAPQRQKLSLDQKLAVNTESDEPSTIDQPLDCANYIDHYLTPFTDELVSYIKQALQPYFQAESDANLDATSDGNLDTNSEGSVNTDDELTTTTSAQVATNTQPQIERVVLCGGSASLSQLDDILQQKLGLPVSIANPFQHMTISPTIDQAQLIKDAPRLMTACGLSLRACAAVKQNKKGWLWRR